MSDQAAILIGNGQDATEREYGEEIDSYMTVVRFNNFETKGYEKFVGSKTDIWATRICATIKPRDTTNINETLGVVNWCKYTSSIMARVPKFSKDYPRSRIITSFHTKRYSQRFGYDKDKNWLSVGMITILYLLEFGYTKLYLYGFGGDTKEHYFKLRPRDPQYHNFEKEGEYIDKLARLGRIVKI